MYRDRLLVQLDQVRPEEGPSRSKLMALDAATGKAVWEAVERPVPESWSTPVVISTPTGDQIVTCANPWVISYDPATGSEIWRVKCLDADVVPSAVYAGGLVFAMMEIAELSAIRPDGTGDVTESHVAWTVDEDLSSIPSPVSDGERLFVLSSVGFMTCWDVQSGKRLWDQDLELAFQASPVLVGDRIYAMSDEGTGVVMKASSKYEEIARPELGEYVSASPAFVSRGGDGRIYIRGEEHLFCIGGGGRGSPPAGEAGAPTAEGDGQ
jgi:outer membrane protein assembly factor BamB